VPVGRAAGILARVISSRGTEDEELDASWIIAFDEKGNDLALEAQLAMMTPDERAESEASPRFHRRVESPRCAVARSERTGSSIRARWSGARRAQRLAAAGRRPLYLCFTDALAARCGARA